MSISAPSGLLAWARLRAMTEMTGAAAADVLKIWDTIFDWARRFGLRPRPLGLAGCAVGMTPALDPDATRLGAEAPRRGDLLIVAGPVSEKMAPLVRRLWDEMPEPKWSIVLGSCGGFYPAYAVVREFDRAIPVDVQVPGCPPRLEDLLQGLLELEKKTGLAEVHP